MTQRLKDDFQLSVMILLSTCAFLGITPFAIYRFYQQNYLAGVVDTLVLISIVSTTVYVWLTGRKKYCAPLLAAIACVGGVVVATVLKDVGVFWMFPPLLVSFFLAPPALAVAINLLSVLAVVVIGVAFPSLEHLYTFVTTAVVVSVCSYIFAVRHEGQRLQLEKLATQDALTGAMNRHAMERALALAVQTSEVMGARYALAMLDLDHFKQINDRHGHIEGDNVLVECANLIREHTREADLLFRFGGEEFVLLMPGIHPAGMRSVISNLHRVIGEQLQTPDSHVTASFGVAMWLPGESWRAWLARADDALYQAKNSGRNCIVIDEAEATDRV